MTGIPFLCSLSKLENSRHSLTARVVYYVYSVDCYLPDPLQLGIVAPKINTFSPFLPESPPLNTNSSVLFENLHPYYSCDLNL